MDYINTVSDTGDTVGRCSFPLIQEEGSDGSKTTRDVTFPRDVKSLRVSYYNVIL